MNYGIWMNSAEQVMAGFETSSGINLFATSPNAYNDNQRHYAVVTYDGVTVKLYVDGVLESNISTSGAIPDSSGTQPVRWELIPGLLHQETSLQERWTKLESGAMT
jgi:Concanavalin A-like lectin/glucanases superfamily